MMPKTKPFLADEHLRLYKTERKAYHALTDHQGGVLPQILATVDLDITPTDSDLGSTQQRAFEPFKVKGLLLQYIDDFNLWDIAHRCPRSQ